MEFFQRARKMYLGTTGHSDKGHHHFIFTEFS